MHGKLLSKKIQHVEVCAEEFHRRMRVTGSNTNYIIFFTPRSGSSWLTDLLTNTDRLGRPEEWFNPNFTPDIAASIGANRPLDYLKLLRRLQQTSNGVFGAEATYFQYRTIDGFDLIDELEPKSIFYLRRRDVIAQGVSLYRAVASDSYHNTQGLQEDEIQRIEQKAPYNAQQIQYWVDHIVEQEVGFEKLFQERDLYPQRLYYEDVIGKNDKALAIFYRYILEENFDPALGVDSSHDRISSSSSGAVIKKFNEENAEYIKKMGVRRPAVSG